MTSVTAEKVAMFCSSKTTVCAVFGLILGVSSALAAEKAQPAPLNALATPPGITLEPLGNAQGYGTGKSAAAFVSREQIAFADLRGMTLYTFDQDPIGKSVCTGACAESWRPAVAPKDAQATAGWSVLKRGDGVLQWALHGKPLYTFAQDVDPGSSFGNSPARFGGKRKNGIGEFVGGGSRGSGAGRAAPDKPVPKEWKVALAFPVAMKIPAGLAVREVPDAQGLVLADFRGLTVYAFQGDLAKEKGPLDTRFIPVSSPQFSKAVGDFGFLVRADGIRQWTYRGRALFTFSGDLAADFAEGIGADKHFEVAKVYRYFVPAGVDIRNTPGQGKILTTAQGMTLYRRSGYILQSGGGHSLRRGQPIRPAVGRDIGINIRCDQECSRQWRPLLAPPDAQAQGQWNVAVHPDGTKQWVYQGYSLWSYAGDKAPGDMNGNDIYDFTFADEAGMPADAPRKALMDMGTPQDGAPALYWTIAIP
jgi:predicted lipoprotein with Yx(FWY)xxD motif